MGKIYVVETLVAREGQAGALKDELMILVEHSRKEWGCLQYDLFQDLADPHRLTVVMCFKDRKAYDDHNNALYIHEFVENFSKSLYQQVIEHLYHGVDVK
jgi:quinol monooxygenase YgiN